MTPFRVAYSNSMFTDVNQNDALASVKVWSQVLFEERFPVKLESSVLNGVEPMTQALRNKLVDAATVCTSEYWAVAQHVRFSRLFYSIKGGQITEQYILVVRQDSGIEQVEQLRRHSITFFQNPRASLALIWLETVLLQKNLGRTAQFCGRVTQATKLPRVVLPVFFRQTDACVVTRSGFETMNELNPQMNRQLKIIASSPEVVPVLFCIREDYTPSFLDQIAAEMKTMHTSAAGKQVLTVFQCDAIKEGSRSALDSAIELLENHRRLSAAAEGIDAVKPKTPSAPARGRGTATK